MRPAFLDSMSWEMAEVYGAVTDRLLVNLAKYFPYIKSEKQIKGSFEYQARMLAQMGQVSRESVDIIMQSMDGADAALRQALEASIMDALKNEEPKLRQAAQKGLLRGGGMLPAEVSPTQMQAFRAYYTQSADKLNLVNTVMLESTENAYRATVADVTAKISRTQSVLNVSAGEVVTGVSTWNKAMHDAVQKMVANGLTGFVDHAGRRWSPEAYVAMDIRTTMFNTARAAVWERAESYGADLYQVSSHNGARPLCYPWQAKVISRSEWSGEVKDLYGEPVHVYAQSETSYGEPAGLFGINCKHYPMTFIPGFSTLRGEPQDPEENAEAYALSQEQRGLERRLREEKRDLEVMRAQGASEDEIKVQRQRVRAASADIEEFCDEHDLPRRRSREYAPVNATWPDKETWGDVTQRNVQNVASQATQAVENVVQSEMQKAENPLVTEVLPKWGIKEVEVAKWESTPTTEEIISLVGGGDQTKGSCASVSFAYAGNKAGYNVRDFRGGDSGSFFSKSGNIREVAKFKDVVSTIAFDGNDFKSVGEVIKDVVEGKEYILATGQHATIIRKIGAKYEYLELQSINHNGFHPLNNDMLKRRFGCKKSHTLGGQKVSLSSVLIDVDSLGQSPDFIEMLKYINTPAGEQMKGVGGGIR